MINIEALFKISYGLYLIGSGNKESGNGYVSNTVFQVSADPPKIATACSKNNFTCEMIKKSGVFSVSVLHQDTSNETIVNFGYKSGRDINKFPASEIIYSSDGTPIVLNDSIAWFSCKVEQSVDAGSHIIFIGEVIESELLDDSKEPMTYAYYRQTRKGRAPKNAPTYVDRSKLTEAKIAAPAKKYRCVVCGYVYDDSVEKIKFADLPSDWVCPVCGSDKSDFVEF